MDPIDFMTDAGEREIVLGRKELLGKLSDEVVIPMMCPLCRYSIPIRKEGIAPHVRKVRLECGCVGHQGCLTKWFRSEEVCPDCEYPVSKLPECLIQKARSRWWCCLFLE
jgi:hypothetical protein